MTAPDPVPYLMAGFLLNIPAHGSPPPIFRAYTFTAAAAALIYQPANTPWLVRWYGPMVCLMLAFRLAVAAEALYRIFPRRWALGVAGIGAGWGILSWEYTGLKLAPWVEIVNVVQVGTWLAFLVPMMILWQFGDADWRRVERAPMAIGVGLRDPEAPVRHAWILLAYLGVYAGVSMASIALRYFGRAWAPVNLLAYGACAACCIAWVIAPRERSASPE